METGPSEIDPNVLDFQVPGPSSDAYQEAMMEGFRNHLDTLCNRSFSSTFPPSSQTISAWRNLIDAIKKRPEILHHPSLACIYHLLLMMGVKPPRKPFELRIPLANLPKLPVEGIVESNSSHHMNPASSNGIRPNGLPNVTKNHNGNGRPVPLPLCHIDNIEFDGEVITIKECTIMPNMKHHAEEIIVFLVKHPRELYSQSYSFITDFLIRFGVRNSNITKYVTSASTLNETKRKYSLTHKALTLYMKANALNITEADNIRHRIRKAERELKNRRNKEESENSNTGVEHMPHEIISTNANDTNETAVQSDSESSQGSESDESEKEETSGSDSDTDDSSSSSEEEGFSGKRKHKKKSRKNKRARLHHQAAGVPLSFHPRSNFRQHGIRNSTDETSKHAGHISSRSHHSQEKIGSRSEFRKKSKFMAASTSTSTVRMRNGHNRLNIENDQKPIGCPSNTGCPVRFLYIYTMQKHMSTQHPKEEMSSDFINNLSPNGEKLERNGSQKRKRHRFSVSNDKKPVACPSATGCTVRFMYEQTMEKHFHQFHPKEILPNPKNRTSASAIQLRAASSSMKVKQEGRPLANPTPVPKPRQTPINGRRDSAKSKPNSLGNSHSHVAKVHKYSVGNDQKPHGCPSETGCKVRFVKRKNVFKHFREQHPNEPLPYLTTPVNAAAPPTQQPASQKKPIPKGRVKKRSKSTGFNGRAEHILNRGGENAKKPFGCPSKTDCPVRFLYQSTMQRHYESQHPDEAR